MSYTIKAFYKKCDNTAIETEGSDTIIVYRASDPINATVTNAPCFNTSTGLITITTPIGPTFEYSINGGTNWQTIPAFTVSPGNYTILSRKINTNCTSTISVTVTQPTAFTATATNTNVNCTGNNGSITIIASGGTPGYQYSINNGTTYQTSNQFFNLSPGAYNNILVKDANNCIQTLAKTILFIDTMYLSLNPDTTICAGSSIVLKPITNSLTNNFTWTPAVSLSNSSIKNPIASPTDTTKYSLIAQWGNCTRTANITVNVLRKPMVYAGKDTSICANTLATLNGTISNTSGSVSYNWSPTATLATPLLLTTTAKPRATQQYILTSKDNYGCNFLVADSMWVNIPPPIIPFAGNDTNAVYGIPHQLSATGGSNYLWSPAGSLNNPFIQSPLATLYTDTYFTVVVSDATGCKKTDDIFVKVYKGPTYYVPNSFTPNGDNLNDIFRPLAVGITGTEYFRVFNRYGQLIYQTNKWMQGWDGTYKGQKAPTGNYVWMIKGQAYTGAVIQMKGSVILLR
jgi:gliding motility-associated-like protein